MHASRLNLLLRLRMLPWALRGARVARLQKPMATFPAAIRITADQTCQTLHHARTVRTVRVIDLALRTQHKTDFLGPILIQIRPRGHFGTIPYPDLLATGTYLLYGITY